MGLGSLASGTAQSYVEKLNQAGQISSPAASIVLGKEPTPQPSRVTFGGPDSTGYTGSIFNYTVTENYWSLAVSDVYINEIKLTEILDLPVPAMIDSSTESILLTNEQFLNFTAIATSIHPDLICGPNLCYSDNVDVTCSNFTNTTDSPSTTVFPTL